MDNLTGQPTLADSSAPETVPPQLPWTWRPDTGAWFEKLERLIAAWHPQETLHLDGSALADALRRAAAARSSWLLHPCINSLTFPTKAGREQRDFNLAVWVAANDPSFAGSVEIRSPLRFWTPEESITLRPQRYSLRELGDRVNAALWPLPLTVDVWCDSVGMPLPETWAAAYPAQVSSETESDSLAPSDREAIAAEVMSLLRTLSLAQSSFYDCLTWVAAVTQVIVPLYSRDHTLFHSGSQSNIPGTVYIDLYGGTLQIMEALVHESAHRHLFIAEAEGPLIDPDHTGLYASPLRPEPRPLRGILLAYHAIAYICAFYVEALDQGVGAEVCREELPIMQQKLQDAEQTLASHSRFLTADGGNFFMRTQEVAEYGRRHSPLRVCA